MQSCTASSRCRAYTLDCGDDHFDQLDCSESSDRAPPGVAESCWSSGWQVSKQQDTVKRKEGARVYKRDGSDLFGLSSRKRECCPPFGFLPTAYSCTPFFSPLSRNVAATRSSEGWTAA